jgi:hypothetical protein
MQLISAHIYSDELDDIDQKLRTMIERPPAGLEIFEGNAGRGADWPVAVFRSASAFTIALTVFGAPKTIKENWPIWKDMFDKASSVVIEKFNDLRIDRDSAQMIAMNHAVEVLGVQPEWLEVHMAIRHFDIGVGDYEDLLNTKRVVMEWPDFHERGDINFIKGVESVEEASKQAKARYIFGITDYLGSYTIIVEKDGTVSFAEILS